ncbi:MAG: radical SAM family heme chaperone HemW, partial [Clostridia bacterium]|nr:radical SAM family heme chaperone HemW [Clostridia bacterium]
FFGGGTPTLVDAAYITETLKRLRRAVPFEPDAEITCEGNPGTLTPEKLARLRKAGVNRLSLGAQSFDDALLTALGRIHTAAQTGEAVRMARDAGFGNVSLDLMYALPGQHMEQWRDTLDAAVSLGVEHISAYSLIVEPGTPMAARVASGAAALPEDDDVNAMQRYAVNALARAGYGRYEISNFARRGFECRHNLVYWNRGDYLGVGCAAHSLLDGRRFHNPESLDGYLAGGREEEAQRLTAADAAEETVMLATRTVRGLDMARWERDFGAPFRRGREAALARLARGGLIETDGGFLRLTPRGMELHNAVVLELLEDTKA